MGNEQPVHKERIGAFTASIWKNDGAGGGVFYTVDVTRSYKDGDEWKESRSFRGDDCLNVAKLFERAEAWIAAQS